jgi:hypothetical protein
LANGIEIKKGRNYLDMGDLLFGDSNPENAFHTIKNSIINELGPDHKIISLGGESLLFIERRLFLILYIKHNATKKIRD